MIGIIDYGVGNLGSVLNMFKKVGVPASLVRDSGALSDVQGLLLPGIGRFDYAMEALTQSGLRGVLEIEVLEKKKPILGICVGFQMMTRFSEEGNGAGLGWLDAEVKRFAAEIHIPKQGMCRFDMKDFAQSEKQPVKLDHSNGKCAVRMWEQGERVTVAFNNCPAQCEREAFDYVWPILVDRKAGRCV